MSPHVSLPTASEIDFDITESISGNTCSGTSKGVDQPLGTKLSSLDVGTILDPSINIDGEDDETFIEAQRAALNRKASNIKGKANKKSSGFQSMGLDAHLMKAIIRKGFNVPTPIQRKTIPLILDHQDVVGMARTGSGKTAAFVIPMIQKLKAHSARVGARALILSPSRELALQTLKVVKELSRGTDLKCVLLVGGDSLEDQFRFMAANPDIIIATPGRFLHLKIEMSLDISSVKYVVFDEADRLFEMGFSIQLNEILHALSSSRQTLLFSATLPRSLVEFAKAGLQEPSLVRLDAESKVSTDLESAFFSVKSAEKEAALLYILNDLIKVPTETGQADSTTSENNKKRKRAIETKSKKMPTEHSTIVFAATKHHVEYLAEILRLSGFTVSHAYGSLDQVARNIQVENFRTGVTNILVVTDVAARGIDIPILANVINYDFPPQPKVFVHRVGRTARAGQRGWSYSLVRDTDAPYLLDLQLFLGRRLLLGRDADISTSFAKDIIVGCLPRDKIESITEWATNMINGNDDLNALRSVAGKGERLYIKTRNSASSESIKRAKEIISSKNWSQLHLLFQDESSEKEHARIDMLARVSDFRPPETIFEVGTKGKSHYSEIANIMRQRRAKINPIKQKVSDRTSVIQEKIERIDDNCVHNLIGDKNLLISEATAGVDVLSDDEVSDDELEVTFSKNYQKDKDRSRSWKDSENFISYTPKNINIAEERGYGVHSGSYNTASQNSNFLQTARDLVMDLANDDSGKSFSEPTKAKGMRWDKKNSKYVSRANDEDGSKGVRMIRSESGQKIAASFKSGRFDKWRKANKFDRLPRIGELEKSGTTGTKLDLNLSTRYKHKQTKEPKEADPFRDDFHIRKKRVAEAKEKRIGRWRDGTGKQEIRTTDDIRKQRKLAERKKAKNARPVKKTRK